MSARTPGPWRVGDAGKTVFGPPRAMASPQIVANVGHRDDAPVLAAAPEMLAALRELVTDGECYCDDNVAARGTCGHCKASALVARVGGGQ